VYKRQGLRARYRPGEIAAVAHDLACAFLDLAKGRPGPPRRMRQLVGAVGAAAVFAKAGLSPSKSEGRPAGVSDAFIGFRPYTDEGRGFFSFGLAFGQCDGEAVTRLADLAERFGDGFLRTTPWRALVIAEVEPDAANKLARKGEKAGFITSIEDPRRTIVACPGKPACLSATVKTREDAAKLARSGIAGGRMVHVSGCAKGCSHPRAAPVTIAGRDGRYDLILNGRAGDVARRQGLDIGGVIAALQDIFGGVPA